MDFKQISVLPITDLATKLGFSLTPKGDQLVGTCPISQVGGNTAFKITPSMNRFICFCPECKKLAKQGGDNIELMRRLRRCEAREAAAEVQKLFSGVAKADDKAPAKQEASPSPKSSDFDPLKYLATLDAAHDALKDLDILPETLITFKAGYSSKGLNRGRLAVAWHDHSGTVRAFIGVALDGTVPRYLMPKGTPLPYWFGIDRLEEGSELRILPTVLDLLRAAENGATNVICPLAPTNGDALTSLKALIDERSLVIEF